jgi:membrane associated rhomboid family serine protease
MWLIFPIGHDQGIRHFPWVTAAIAAVCVVVQLLRTVGGPSEENLIAASEEVSRIEGELLTPHLLRKLHALDDHGKPDLQALRTRMRTLEAERTALVAQLRAGTLVPREDRRYRDWLAARDREQRLLRRDLGWRMAYRPADGARIELLLSAFAHAGWMHLLGNMLFLYLVGCNLEDRWGRSAFTAMYLGGAVASALAFYLWHRHSETMLVGASGAVAAAMGAFLICFHRARINFLVWSPFRGVRVSEVYAFWVFPVWFLQQLFNSWLEAHMNLGVAYSAHVGGFAFGLAAALALKVSGVERRRLLPATAVGTEWKEDPEYLQALEKIAAKDLPGAVSLLKAVLSRQPRHEGALEQLARISVKLGEPDLAGQAVSAYLVELGLARMSEVVPLTKELRLLDQPFALSDRAGAVIVRATAAEDEPALMIQAAIRLIAHHPGSPLAPGVMWDVARLQERIGRKDLARGTLSQLAARYPDDPFAEQARRKLEA